MTAAPATSGKRKIVVEYKNKRRTYGVGKLGAASPVRHLVRDGKPVEQTR